MRTTLSRESSIVKRIISIIISAILLLSVSFYIYSGEPFPFAYEILSVNSRTSADPVESMSMLFSKNKTPLVIAHRGAHTFVRENSLKAVERAYLRGYDGVELDVSVTGDGIPVLFHDADAGDVEKNQFVQKLTFRELEKRNESIDALSTVIEKMGGKILFILELKYQSGVNFSWINGLCEELSKRKLQNTVILSSLNIHIANRIARDCPDFHHMFESGMDLPEYYAVLKDHYSSPFLSINWKLLDTDGLSGIPDSVFEDYIVSVYTPNRKTDLERSVRLGARIIQTDRPGLLMHIKESFIKK